MSSHHFVTVCVVCVLCATHAPCSAHNDISSTVTKTSWDSPDSLELLPTSWRKERSNVSPESTAGMPKKYDENTKIIHRQIKETKRTGPKKYSHSYSEERALRIAAKMSKKNSPTPDATIINDQLVQQSEILRNFDNSINYDNIEKKTRNRRNSPEVDEKYFMKKLFEFYGDGKSLSIDGFEKLLKKLGLFRLVENIDKFDDTSVEKNRGSAPKDSEKDSQGIGSVNANSINSQQRCLNSDELLSKVSQNSSDERSNKTIGSSVTNLPDWLFMRVCPVLIYHLAGTRAEREGCIVPMNAYSPTMTSPIDEIFVVENVNEIDEDTRNMVQVWTYSTISIVIISVSGLLGMFVVPFMGKRYYHQVLQFFVALAIGTLCGDALIHLLPHAMMSPHSHSHDASVVSKNEHDVEAEHNLNMWKGLTAMIGLIIFFFTEKALAMIAEWRKHRQRKNKLPSRVRVMRESDGGNSNNVGEKLCKHKYSSYPYCYGEITTETRDNHHDRQHNDHERATTIDEEKPLTSKCNSVTKITTENHDLTKKTITNNLSSDDWRADGENGQLKNNEKSGNNVDIVNPEIHGDIKLNESESYTVIIREHENKHHGHTHSHGHVHAAPESMSSVAWMVVMGDGLHNFTDGMAIGAAFAANIAGGFSTAIAVFCHELPHELGDFAVLLKAGMSWQQALFYNLLSSVLCLFGMIIGVLLGATPAVTSWIFAAAAGMFIYIALVDMIPELSSSHSEEGGSHWECILQAAGLLSGLGIMLIIALYEHDLKNIFSD